MAANSTLLVSSVVPFAMLINSLANTLMLPAALPGSMMTPLPVYRVEDVLLNFCRDKKRLDRDSISLQTLKTIAAHNDWSQGEL